MQRAFYQAYLKSTVEVIFSFMLHSTLSSYILPCELKTTVTCRLYLLERIADPVVEGLDEDIVDVQSLNFFCQKPISIGCQALLPKMTSMIANLLSSIFMRVRVGCGNSSSRSRSIECAERFRGKVHISKHHWQRVGVRQTFL